MRYIFMIKASCEFEAGRPPNPELVAGMAQLAEEMTRAGMMIATEGLLPSSMGTRVRHTDGKRHITDGPFVEAKELIGGFAILRVRSKEHAIEMANRVVDLHVRCGMPEIDIELRPLFDPPDHEATGPGNCGSSSN